MSLPGLPVSFLLLPRASSHVLSLQKAVPLEECSDQQSHDLSYRRNFLRTKHPPIWSPLGAVSSSVPSGYTDCTDTQDGLLQVFLHYLPFLLACCYSFGCQYCCGKALHSTLPAPAAGEAVVFGALKALTGRAKKEKGACRR